MEEKFLPEEEQKEEKDYLHKSILNFLARVRESLAFSSFVRKKMCLKN